MELENEVARAAVGDDVEANPDLMEEIHRRCRRKGTAGRSRLPRDDWLRIIFDDPLQVHSAPHSSLGGEQRMTLEDLAYGRLERDGVQLSCEMQSDEATPGICRPILPEEPLLQRSEGKHVADIRFLMSAGVNAVWCSGAGF